MTRRVGEILDSKGSDVVTIRPDADLHEALATLAEHSIGAVVVSPDGNHVDGMLSERDIVRALARTGSEVLDESVSSVMSSPVSTCGREHSADEIMATMTSSRFRHMPVVDNDVLVGIVSIGDVVKSRIDELEVKATNLEEYVTGSSY
ncbi:MAG: CBS domain-containing protein [Nitriliruptorales bacterium]|nr:CBS domain-containing protein [Nitriliruptorales bacterium]